MNQEVSGVHPLVVLYGEDVFDLASAEIKELAQASNIPFTSGYMKLGTSFTLLKAQEIVNGKSKKRTLKDLITESFGEAAVYKYNVNGGVDI